MVYQKLRVGAVALRTAAAARAAGTTGAWRVNLGSGAGPRRLPLERRSDRWRARSGR